VSRRRIAAVVTALALSTAVPVLVPAASASAATCASYPNWVAGKAYATGAVVRYTDGKWGNRDLEWLVIEACGPLRPLSDGKDVIERWGPTFAGLHILLGYATVSWVTVPTPATEGFVTPEQYEQRAKIIPLRRNGTPEDIAHAAAFLLSDEAAFINGAMLAIDGGIIAAG